MPEDDFDVPKQPVPQPPGEPDTNPKAKAEKPKVDKPKAEKAKPKPRETDDDEEGEKLTPEEVAHRRREAEHIPVFHVSMQDMEATWANQDRVRREYVIEELAKRNPEVRELLTAHKDLVAAYEALQAEFAKLQAK